MPINYPTTQPQTTSNNIANYIKYAVGVFADQGNIVQTQAYTASYDAAAWLFSVSSSVPTSTTMSIAVPTASFVTNGGASAPQFYLPALEFWRLDTRDVEVKLSSSNPNVVFGFSSTSTFILPTSSYTNLVQLDEGGTLRYIILEQSPLP